MSDTPETTTSSTPPQTSNVFVDRPCLKCGYNLRGQTATWNRRALNWQVTCPECGGSQVVVLGGAERRGLLHPFFALTLALLGGWLSWQLIQWLSEGQSSMMEVPTAIYDANGAAQRTTLAAATPQTLAIHVAVRAVPVILSTMLFGAMLALAPYASHRQRDLLLVIFIVGGCIFGVYMNITGVSLDGTSYFALQRLTELRGADARGMLMLYDWKWRLVSGTISLMLAILAGRIGLAVGRPLGKLIAGMYVRADT